MILCGDCVDVMGGMEPCSNDLVLTDPPYELGFMGKHWDASGVAFQTSTWQAAYRVLKPGGSLVAFGGTRTHHRLMCAIEDAGFEIRDVLMWLYGSGFPKSLDISKAIDKAAGAEREIVGKRTDGRYAYEFSPAAQKSGGIMGNPGKETKEGGILTSPATPLAQIWQGYGTALKPAYEPIIWAMKPLDGTFAHNAEKHGVAGVNVDAGRIAGGPSEGGSISGASALGQSSGWNVHNNRTTEIDRSMPQGRFPANLILDEAAGKLLDEQSGATETHAGQGSYGPHRDGIGFEYPRREVNQPSSSGGASRFFYCPKASRAEREKGLEGCEAKQREMMAQLGQGNTPQQTPHRNLPTRNHHPTVKPVALMKYLLTLFNTPTGGRVLDPFCGSGSTGVACAELGRDFTGIDTSAEYCAIARKRIDAAARQQTLNLTSKTKTGE